MSTGSGHRIKSSEYPTSIAEVVMGEGKGFKRQMEPCYSYSVLPSKHLHYSTSNTCIFLERTQLNGFNNSQNYSVIRFIETLQPHF